MQIDPVQFDYARSALIKSPFADLQNKENKEKITRIVIDSRDRDKAIFPSPAMYEIQLPDDIDEVTSIELVVSDIPFKAYNVSTRNNNFSCNGTEYTIEPGNYTGALLASTLMGVLTPENVVVTYNQVTDKITFSGSSGAISIEPTKHSLNKTVGLDTNTTYISDVSNVIIAPYRINLSDNQYIILNVDQATVNNSINPNLHKSFAVLNPLMSQVNFSNTNTKIIKYLNPPIARITKLKIRLTDYYGELYDFQNHDNRLEFILVSRKHLKRFT